MWGEDMLELCLFLLVLNFDCFLCGLALGVAGIKVSRPAACLVAACSALFFGGSLLLGEVLLVLLPLDFLHDIGLALLLLLIVVWLLQFCGGRSADSVGKFWRRPQNLDTNTDKNLSGGEAVLLALALGVDSLGGGLAFGLLGEKPLFWTLLAAVMTYVLLFSANKLGRLLLQNLRQ